MYGYIETHVVEHVQVFGAYWCHRLQSNTITIAPIWRKRRSGRKFYNFRLNDSVVVYCCRCMYVCMYVLTRLLAGRQQQLRAQLVPRDLRAMWTIYIKQKYIYTYVWAKYLMRKQLNWYSLLISAWKSFSCSWNWQFQSDLASRD